MFKIINQLWFKTLKIFREMKNPNWGYWEFLSERNRQRESCCRGCDCQVICNCENLEWQKFQNDFLYESSFMNPSCRPVNFNNAMVLNEKGIVMGPYTFVEWYDYSWQLLEQFHDILNGKEVPHWNDLYFRHMYDFVAGSYAFFSDISLVLCNKLQNDHVKHFSYYDMKFGLDVTNNLKLVEKHQAKKIQE